MVFQAIYRCWVKFAANEQLYIRIFVVKNLAPAGPATPWLRTGGSLSRVMSVELDRTGSTRRATSLRLHSSCRERLCRRGQDQVATLRENKVTPSLPSRRMTRWLTANERGTNRISASRLYETALFLEMPIEAFFCGLDDDQDGGARAGRSMGTRFPPHG